MKVELSPLETNLGYLFVDRTLLIRALTTTAYANYEQQHGRSVEDQDTLSTLGDAVLKAVLVHALMEAGCDSSGEITERKKALEQEAGLAAIARRLGVGGHLRLDKGQAMRNEQDHPNLLAETLEAIVGAIYLDVGFKAAKRVVLRWFEGLQ